MSGFGSRQRTIAAAQRGHIIQRVLIEGWSTAEAAVMFDVEERRVTKWVADYNRWGMASLKSVRVSGGRPALPASGVWAAFVERLRHLVWRPRNQPLPGLGRSAG